MTWSGAASWHCCQLCGYWSVSNSRSRGGGQHSRAPQVWRPGSGCVQKVQGHLTLTASIWRQDLHVWGLAPCLVICCVVAARHAWGKQHSDGAYLSAVVMLCRRCQSHGRLQGRRPGSDVDMGPGPGRVAVVTWQPTAGNLEMNGHGWMCTLSSLSSLLPWELLGVG